jgi:hypothetical protein
VRWQSGFFAADSLGIFDSALQRMAKKKHAVHALIGSNEQCTIRKDVERLVAALGIPREKALLGVVSYSNGYYHPKTFHVRRSDGSQAAYVGSANLIGSGVTSLHVEAGVTVDNREGDPTEILDGVASAVDYWFKSAPPGLYQVTSPSDVERLVEGVLAEIPPPRLIAPARTAEGEVRPSPRNRLQPLIALQRLEKPARESRGVAVEAAKIGRILLPAVPRPDFPPYLLFAPGQGTPTKGIAALSGASLPTNVAGLVIRLNRDSARHFEGRPGTANISVPVASLSTFRFGLFPGRYPRPRAEFALQIRYLSRDAAIPAEPTETNIMAYGFIAGESGHGDVRMLVPGVVKLLAQNVKAAGRKLPGDGDVALLEWPTSNDKREFRLSFLEQGSPLFRQAARLFIDAQKSNSTVGEGACWLPNDFSPVWD